MKKVTIIAICLLVISLAVVVSGCAEKAEVKKAVNTAAGSAVDDLTGTVEDVTAGTAQDIGDSAEQKAQNAVDKALDGLGQ